MTLQLTDEKLKIPMYRLTKSYNISVTVALCIQTIITIIRFLNYNQELTNTEKETTLLNQFRNNIKESSLIEQRFNKEINRN